MDLHVRHDVVGDVPVVSVDGTVDLATIPRLHDELRRAVAEHAGSVVVVDLDGVGALDDCGLGILLGVAGHARENGGDLVVVATREGLRARFGVTGLDRALDVRDHL